VALARVAIDVEVFTTTANGDKDLPASDSEPSFVHGVPVRYFERAMPRRFFGAAGMKQALENEVASFNLVHVHGIWNVPGWLAIDTCRKLDVPYVVSPRGMLDPGSFAHHRLRKSLCYRLKEKGNLRSASLLHATSQQEARSLEKLRLGREIILVPNGVDPPPLAQDSSFRSRWRLPPKVRLITFLGRLHPTKRLDLLFSAFHQLQSSIPDAMLVLAGARDGIDPDSLALDERARWLGELDENEKWRLLSESSALVLCSDSESFGMSVVEALSMGVPVVVTRSCPWEDVEVRGCGVWVPQDSGSIADGLRRILGNRDLASKMGEKGRALAAERYQWPAIGRDMARCYERVTAENLGR
jgi:glycosyltransferase involved in cell wall biosynthesis